MAYLPSRTPDRSRLDAVYQYTLATAALSEDFRQRQLGLIHLLKYAYLADLAHATRHEGATFSGTEWRFYHFGPWSGEAFQEIGPALLSISATEMSYASRHADDFARYGLEVRDAEGIARRFEDELPFVVSNAISQAVHEHGADTADLLRHVYLTSPMLAARPGDVLDFRTAVRPRTLATGAQERRKLSASEKRRRAAIIYSARAEVQKRLAAARKKGVEPSPLPRYDAIFDEGTAQLDRMAGEPLSAVSGEVVFDDSVWNSSQRRDDPDLP